MDFETGDLSQVYGLGEVTDAPPSAVCGVVTDIVRDGNYAMRSYQADPAVNNRSKAVLSELDDLHLKRAYYGISVYLSPTLISPDWLQLFQLTQYLDGGWPVLVQLQISAFGTPDGKPRLSIVKTGIAPTNALWTDSEPIPLGEYIDFVLYLDIDEYGTVKLWQNGQLKAKLNYDTRADTAAPAAYPEFGLYQSADRNPGGNWVVHDRFVLASTYWEASSMPISSLALVAIGVPVAVILWWLLKK